MRELQFFEGFEKQLRSARVPNINIIDQVMGKMTETKRKKYHSVRKITGIIATIIITLIFTSIGAYATITRLQAKSRLGNISYTVAQLTQEEYIARNQGTVEWEKLSGFVDRGEYVLVGFLDSSYPKLYEIAKGENYNYYNKAKEVLNNLLSGFLVVPEGYTFENAYILYEYEVPDRKICRKYIDEAIKNKQRVVKIPLIKSEEISDLSYIISKDIKGNKISFRRAYLNVKGNDILTEIYGANKEISKTILFDQEVIVTTSANRKEISWVEEYKDKKILCHLTVPVSFTTKEITAIFKEVVR